MLHGALNVPLVALELLVIQAIKDFEHSWITDGSLTKPV